MNMNILKNGYNIIFLNVGNLCKVCIMRELECLGGITVLKTKKSKRELNKLST